MSFENDGSKFLEAIRNRRLTQVRPGNLVAQIKQHLGDATHPDATDTYEMNALNFCEHEKKLSAISFQRSAFSRQLNLIRLGASTQERSRFTTTLDLS